MSPSRQIVRDDSNTFWEKAKEFRALMEVAQEQNQWNSLGLAAVHCAISANDALLAFFAGRRASGSDHREAILLLIKHVKSPETKVNSEHLKRVIVKKNLIAYEAKLISNRDAQELYQHTTRFYTWAQRVLKLD